MTSNISLGTIDGTLGPPASAGNSSRPGIRLEYAIQVGRGSSGCGKRFGTRDALEDDFDFARGLCVWLMARALVRFAERAQGVARPAGIEPATLGLEGRCSIH